MPLSPNHPEGGIIGGFNGGWGEMGIEDHRDEIARRGLELDELESLCMRNLLASSEERIYFKDRQGRFLLASRYCVERMAPDASDQDVIGKTDFDFFDEDSAREFFEGELRIIETGEPDVGIIEAEHWLDGSVSWVSTTKLPLRDEKGEIIGTYGISRDISRQVKAEQALAELALHDPLTGLANRALLSDRLDRALLALARQPGDIAVLFLDLDGFKDVNDFAGHEAGDQVLREIATRLRRVTRPTDTIARIGGDEFVVVCADVSRDDIIVICTRLLDAVAEPLTAAMHGKDVELSVSASIGVAIASEPDVSGSDLVRDADVAMYHAKQLGGRRVHFIEPGMRAAAEFRFALDSELRRAIEDREFFLEYQPLVSLSDGSVSTVEAVIRWRHPERGTLSEDDFIAVADRRGLLPVIYEWAFDAACAQLAEWLRAPQRDYRSVSVPVPGVLLRDGEVDGIVRRALERHGVAPKLLCVEISDVPSLLGERPEMLTKLNELGVRIILGGFGTTIAALANSEPRCIDAVKVERQLACDRSEQALRTVAGLNAMAAALGLTVVAEAHGHVVESVDAPQSGRDVRRSRVCADFPGGAAVMPSAAAR